MMIPWSSWPGLFALGAKSDPFGFAVNTAKLPDPEPVNRPGTIEPSRPFKRQTLLNEASLPHAIV
jgi:hypothetical protein